MEDCLFCKIVAGEIPSNKLYEDETLLAFYDIDPQAPVHFLVVPKRHIASAAALTEDDAALLGHIYAVIAEPRSHQRGCGRRPERAPSAFSCAGRPQSGMASGLMR